MRTLDARAGDAVELPEGVFALVQVTRCRAAGLDWAVWELGEGPVEGLRLAIVGDEVFRVKVAAADAMPETEEQTVDHMIYQLRERGEARGERSGEDGRRDFWLGQYRYYVRGERMLLYMDVHDAVERVSGEQLDAQLVNVFQ